METLRIVRHDGSYEYSGIHFHYKGDPVAKQSEASQAAFNTSLMNIFQAQYGKQSAITDYLTQKMQPLINKGGEGYSPEALAAMRTSATDTLSNQFQGAQRAVNATEQRGLPSGVNAQVSGSMQAQEAEAQAQAQLGITQQNEQLKQQNYWNSINVLNGQAATLNPLGYAGSATSGSGAVAGLSNAFTNSNQSQLLGALGGIAGGAGSAFGGYLAGR
jgi:hypothetical protein